MSWGAVIGTLGGATWVEARSILGWMEAKVDARKTVREGAVLGAHCMETLSTRECIGS